jgi:hypothetical protein
MEATLTNETQAMVTHQTHTTEIHTIQLLQDPVPNTQDQSTLTIQTHQPGIQERTGPNTLAQSTINKEEVHKVESRFTINRRTGQSITTKSQ